MITAMPRVAIAVRDMDEAIGHFGTALGMPVHELEWAPGKLGVRLAFCAPPGPSHVELMAPHTAGRPQSESVSRFLDRRGEGLFAMMLYAPDPDAEAAELERKGLPVLPLMREAGGRDLHPRDTAGVLIRIYPSASDADLESEIEQSLGAEPARTSEAGLRGIRSVEIAVPDLGKAVAIYRDRLGIPTTVGAPGQEDRIAVCAPPRGARIELHAPAADDSGIARFRREGGRGLFALVFGSDDPETTVDVLRRHGVATTRLPGDVWEIDRSVTHGARLRFRRTRP